MHEQKVISGPGYQVPFAAAIKKALTEAGKYDKTFVGTVGMITSGLQAEQILQDGDADAILVARAFLQSPALVWEWAAELGISVRIANQFGWGFGQRPSGGVGGGQAIAARG
jgi:2,4-dienoyl-CoA reductase-like NADH-dependent reductase (Old Yellow Enzyme family)